MRRSVFTCSERRAGGSCGTGRAPRRKEALRKKRVQEPACVPPRRPAPCEPSALTLEVRAERSGVVHALLRGRKSRSSPVRCQLHKTTLASPRVRTTGEPHGIKSTSAAVCTPRSCTVFVIDLIAAREGEDDRGVPRRSMCGIDPIQCFKCQAVQSVAVARRTRKISLRRGAGGPVPSVVYTTRRPCRNRSSSNPVSSSPSGMFALSAKYSHSTHSP